MSRTLHDEKGSTDVALNWDLGLDGLTIARFARLVVERDFEHTSESSWPTERMTLEGAFAFAVATFRDHGARTAVLDLGVELGGECLVHLWLVRGRAHLRVASRSVDVLAAAKAWVQERYPVARPSEKQEVVVNFWARDRHGWSASRRIAVPSWQQVADNYPAAVSGRMEALIRRPFQDDDSGRLILWHGPPGTGKTYALRALAWEWRKWCGFHYITDPEAFFGGNPKYMLDVLLDDEDDQPDWRLLVLEDTGELLALDAKDRTGQGLSRLLNVVDGLIGQGLRILMLVTTNEELHALHPAVSRPGRCVAQIEFRPFGPEEADEWLERHGRTALGAARTIASLYGGNADQTRQPRRPIGFAVR